MNKTMLIVAVLFGFGVFSALASAEEQTQAPADAEQDALSLLRAEMRLNRRDFVKQSMALTDEEAKKFWSIYHQYEADMIKINDRKWQVIRDYVGQYDHITEQHADELAHRMANIRQSRVKVMDQYYEKVAKALSYRIAVRFAQVEDIWIASEDLKFGSSLPLMPKQ
jgi:hypothetical protein